MLDAEVVRYKNKGGAVVTNASLPLMPPGDVKEIIPELEKILVVDEEYAPREEKTKLYREVYGVQKKLIKEEMNEAFAELWRVKKILKPE